MMPLLPPSEILYSRRSSNQSYCELVVKSPASLGFAHFSTPLSIVQPDRTSCLPQLCQPSSRWPSNSSTHPAALSSALNELICESAGFEAPPSDNSAPDPPLSRRSKLAFHSSPS